MNRPWSELARFPLILLAIFALLAALWAGLLRLGWVWPVLRPTLPLSHGPLMISGFFGTLISLERAVALRLGWAYLSPLLSGLGGVLLLVRVPGLTGLLLLAAGSFWLVMMFVHILRKHRANYTLVMALGAVSWLVGNLLVLAGWPIFNIVMWWVGFLVLTIAGERLELGRMLRLTRTSQAFFWLAVILFLGGSIMMLLFLDFGARLAGAGMLALALWLLRYDIARYTVKRSGLTRYIAVSLLSGYIWLGMSGLLAFVAGGTSGGPVYDATLHAVLVGFVFGMIFGHAPIIFPAILGIPVNYHPVFYLPLVILNASLVLRILGDLAGWGWIRQWGGLLNALSIVLFLGLLAASRLFRSQLEQAG